MSRHRLILLAIAMILIFFLLTAAIPHAANLDLLVLAGIMARRTPAATHFFRFITFFGTPTFFYPATAALSLAYYTWRRWQGFWGVLITMNGTWGIMEWLKNFYHRPRPSLGPLEPAPGFSFPSGHAMMGTVFFGLLVLWLLKICPPRCRGHMVPVTLIFLLLLGFSRLYLGVHYPTDVLAGYAAGMSILALFLAWWKEG
ncbi:phosphatase PAP2 family protein [Moorella sp. E308F]|uniref:phosphatase PAP2 family protein n=1 Tax=unclassified Neomoorella TaxID=2676739 RepID=UPI0010FFAB36|nr:MULTISPECIES: phosphatase PAP2 family protein [unclassified Moorella (in: firmicutes)]GEA15793.1 phosphatase PAP2 family protein [Moorella sp. E308F]GEA19376.1 phosphatase PAP2 family protein [Moorella sp. E306M]